MRTQRCARCKGEKIREVLRERTANIGGLILIAKVPGFQCETCGEVWYSPAVLKSYELGLAKALAESGTRSGEAFRLMRKAIGIPARELAQILGLTNETISRWETEKREVDEHAMLLLGDLVFDAIAGRTTTKDRLQALREAPQQKVVHLELVPV